MTSLLQPLKDLQIGNIDIGFPVVQAALSGYSDSPMRQLARRFGASYTICEVMLDQFLLALRRRAKTKHFLHIARAEPPVGGQLMGAEPEQFSAGAVRLVEAGFDIIDINFGCPVKKVLGRCRGGFHLSQPSVALEIVRRTREVVPASIPVTVKMRRGVDDSPESRDAFFEILDGAFAAGVAAITVHGRTVQQRYIGPSRWQFLAEVKAHVGSDRTILGSGDLFTAEDCLRMIQETGVDGVTVARGAIGNPWIFAQARQLAAGHAIEPPRIHEQRETIREHFKLAEAMYGESRAPVMMRKFGAKYAASHPQWEEVRKAFVRAKSWEEWSGILDRFYSNDGPGQFPPVDVHKVQSEC